MRAGLESAVSDYSIKAPEKIHTELTDLVLRAAGQVFSKSASNFEKAVASKILDIKFGNFDIKTMEDFLADLVCGGEKWKEYRKTLWRLEYMIQSAPLVLYILVEDGRLVDARELFELVSKTEHILQRQGYEFTDTYVEIMRWVAEKINLQYSPPRSSIESPREYLHIIQTVLNYDNTRDSSEILRVKYHAKKKIQNMFFEEEEVWDVGLLYFAWKLSVLFSLPLIPSRDMRAYIELQYRMKWITYQILRGIPKLLMIIVTILATIYNNIVVAMPSAVAVILLFVWDRWIKWVPRVIQRLINRWSLFKKVKAELEKYQQQRERLKRLGFK